MAIVSSRKPVYAVVTFSQARGGIAIDDTKPANGEASALRIAEKLAESKVGAVAYYRVGDPEIGEFDEPVIVGKFGRVPDELLELFA